MTSGDDWESRTRWFRYTWDIETVASFLGVQANTINVWRNRGSFPAPDRQESRRNGWHVGAVYRFALAHRPEAAVRVPRIFPRVAQPDPATFAGSVSVHTPGPEGKEFVVLRWIPGDGASGLVALAYPVGDPQRSATPAVQAMRLHEEVFGAQPGLLAVVGPETTLEGYPLLEVVDHRGAEDIVGEPHIGRAVNYNWHVLSNLVRTDLPWWPYGLRSGSAMAAWRPLAPPQRIAPFTSDHDPAIIETLIDASTPDLVRVALRRSADRNRWYITGGQDQHATLDCPGLVQAAYPASMYAECPDRWTWEEAIAVLRQPVHDFTNADKAVRQLDPSPAVMTTIRLTPDDMRSSPLAAEWLSQHVTATDSPQLGHLVAARMAAGPIESYAHDRRYEANWVAVESDGTVCVTVGRRMFEARGILTEVELVSSTSGAFFRDSDGSVWPVPYRDSGRFNSGYPGTGPTDFAKAITALLTDASTDLYGHRELDENSRLWAAISTTAPPLHLDGVALRSN